MAAICYGENIARTFSMTIAAALLCTRCTIPPRDRSGARAGGRSCLASAATASASPTVPAAVPPSSALGSTCSYLSPVGDVVQGPAGAVRGNYSLVPTHLLRENTQITWGYSSYFSNIGKWATCCFCKVSRTLCNLFSSEYNSTVS